MIGNLFHVGIYLPIYNALVFFVNLIPNHDIGIAVIIVTIVVRLVLWPLAARSVKAQMAMKAIAPEVEEIKKKHKGNTEAQNRALLELYKESDIHPFAGLLLVFVQIPVLFGLYWVFARGGFPAVDPAYLYAFVHTPPSVNMQFLGLIDMGGHSIVLAVLVALSQAVYTRLSLGPRTKAAKETVEATFSSDMARSFDLQMRYILPAIFAFIGYSVAAAAPLYWLTGNIFMIGQEYIAGKRF